MNTAENELAALATQWDVAMESNVVDRISSFLADNWIVVGGDGITQRTAFLARIASGELTHSRMESDEMHVRVQGDTGIVIARGISAGTFKGEAFELHEWSTSVFVRTASGWKCSATMLAPVVEGSQHR